VSSRVAEPPALCAAAAEDRDPHRSIPHPGGRLPRIGILAILFTCPHVVKHAGMKG
jgi:hypothetical protein